MGAEAGGGRGVPIGRSDGFRFVLQRFGFERETIFGGGRFARRSRPRRTRCQIARTPRTVEASRAQPRSPATARPIRARSSGSQVGAFQERAAAVGLRPRASVGHRGRPSSSRASRSVRQPVEPGVGRFDLVAEPEDHLDARQVDAEVAMEAQDRPDPSDLGRPVPLDVPLADGPDEPSALVAEQRRGRDRELLGHESRGRIGRFMALDRPRARPGFTRARPSAASGSGRRTRSISRGSRRRPPSARPPWGRRRGRRPGCDFEAGTPWPRSRSLWPELVPGGMVRVLKPSSVGTSTLAPRTASAMVIGTSTERSRPSR